MSRTSSFQILGQQPSRGSGCLNGGLPPITRKRVQEGLLRLPAVYVAWRDLFPAYSQPSHSASVCLPFLCLCADQDAKLQAEIAQLERQVLDEQTAELLAALPPVPSSPVVSSPPRVLWTSHSRGRSRQAARAPPPPRVSARPSSLRRTPLVRTALTACHASLASSFPHRCPRPATRAAADRSVLLSGPTAGRQGASKTLLRDRPAGAPLTALHPSQAARSAAV